MSLQDCQMIDLSRTVRIIYMYHNWISWPDWTLNEAKMHKTYDNPEFVAHSTEFTHSDTDCFPDCWGHYSGEAQKGSLSWQDCWSSLGAHLCIDLFCILASIFSIDKSIRSGPTSISAISSQEEPANSHLALGTSRKTQDSRDRCFRQNRPTTMVIQLMAFRYYATEERWLLKWRPVELITVR